MSVSEYFAKDYAGARSTFRSAALSAGARLFTYSLAGCTGPAGEDLSIDVAVLGDAAAQRTLLVISGTHGVEGFAGSGSQVGLLENGLAGALPSGTSAILLHALNPYGFAWLRRANEDGVDLNRNFADFSALPSSAAYEELHDALVPARWDEAHRRAADASIADYITRKGHRAFQAAMSSGQYTRPDGLFYGGSGPTWSANMLRKILAEHAGAARQLAVLDIHTGLGPQGYGEPICIGRDAADVVRAREWYGKDVRNIAGDESVSAVVGGSVADGVFGALPDEQITYVALEFGTWPIEVITNALRAEQCCQARGNVDAATMAVVKRDVLDACYVDTPAWRAAVFGRVADFAYRALRHLGA